MKMALFITLRIVHAFDVRKSKRNLLSIICLVLSVSMILGYMFATVQNPLQPNVTISEGYQYKTRNNATFFMGRAIYVTNQTYGPIQSFMNNSLVLARPAQYSINATANKHVVIENWFDTFGLALNFTSSGSTTVFVDRKTLSVPNIGMNTGSATVTFPSGLIKIICPGSSSNPYVWKNNGTPVSVYCEIRLHWEPGGSIRLMNPNTTGITPNPWSRRASATAMFQVTAWSSSPQAISNILTTLDHGRRNSEIEWRRPSEIFWRLSGLSPGSLVSQIDSGNYTQIVFRVTFNLDYSPVYPDNDGFESANVRIGFPVGPSSDNTQPRIYYPPGFLLDFSFQAAPQNLVVVWPNPGSATSNLVLTRFSGPKSFFSFSCSGLPAGASCSAQSIFMTGPAASSILTVTVTSGLALSQIMLVPYDYSFTVSAFGLSPNGDNLTRTVSMSLKVIFTPANQGEKVLFGDDFLGPNPNVNDAWTYASTFSDATAKASTKAGYMILNSLGTTRTSQVFVRHPAYVQDYSAITFIERKLTVSVIPFMRSESSTAALKIGFSEMLLTGNSFLSPHPDFDDDCTGNVSTEYARIYNNGAVNLVTCSGGSQTVTSLPSIIVNRYTVVTIVYKTIGPSGTSSTPNLSVSMRVYQRSASTGGITYDQNVTVTTGVTPINKANYVFIALQSYSDNQALSQIDLVHLQNYGSPIDLRLPTVPPPSASQSGWIGGMVYLAQLIGFGNQFMGSVFLYFFTMLGLCIPILKFTRNLFPIAVVCIMDTAIFAYAGLIPIYPVILILVGASVIMVLVMRKIVSGGGGHGGGEEDSGGEGP